MREVGLYYHRKAGKPADKNFSKCGDTKMKKITAVLMIALIAMVTVFADPITSGATSLALTYGVSDGFSLSTKFAQNGSELGESLTIATAGTGKFVDTDLVFDIIDHSFANKARSYSLTVSASELWSYAVTGADPVEGPGITLSEKTAVSGESTYDSTADKFTVSFPANLVTDRTAAGIRTGEGTTGGVKVGSFKASWDGGDYPAGTYSATLTLTFVANT